MTRQPFLRLGVAAATTITVSRTTAAADRPQGIVLDADQPLRVEETEATRIVLWSDSAPPTVEVMASAAGELRIWNVWRDGDLVQAWENGAGLDVDDDGDGLGLRCHDGHEGNDADLALRLSFDRAWTLPEPDEAT